MSVLRTPLGRVRSSFGPGPMTLRELRRVLTFAFPSYSSAQVRQMSFEGLCAVLAEELKRVVSEQEWTRMIRRAGSDAPESVIKGQKLLAKNDRLCHQYRPRCVYEGALTIYARKENAHVDGWRRYTSRPPDIRRVTVTARPGRDPHRAFISPENVQEYATDLRNLLESAPRA
jgi:hypothetical protein